MNRSRSRTLIFASLLALLPSSSVWTETPPQPAPGPEFAVHTAKTYQTMEGFGCGFDGNNVPKAFDAIRDPADRERAFDLLFGDPGPRLNVVRLTISPNAQPLPKGGYDWASDDYTQKAWKLVEAALKRSKPIVYAVPFTPPARWKDNGKLTGGGTLKPQYYHDYAEYLVDFLEYHHRVVGVDVDVLSLQNEPDMHSPWLACVWSGDQMARFLKIIGPLVRAHGLATRLMLSEGTCWTGAWARVKPALDDAEARSYASVLASHSYPPMPPNPPAEDRARREFADASVQTGLPVWMSEMSLMIPPQPDDPSMKAAITIANYIHRDLTIGHASVWIYCFALFIAKFQGSMGVLSPSDSAGAAKGRLVVPKRFWAMANYSHFVRPGWKLAAMDGTGPVSTAFVDPNAQRFAIVAVNASDVPQRVSYAFTDADPGAIEAFATNAQLNLAVVQPPQGRPRGFAATLQPISVTTFTGTLSSGPPGAAVHP